MAGPGSPLRPPCSGEVGKPATASLGAAAAGGRGQFLAAVAHAGQPAHLGLDAEDLDLDRLALEAAGADLVAQLPQAAQGGGALGQDGLGEVPEAVRQGQPRDG
jgi:hypothetical protein